MHIDFELMNKKTSGLYFLFLDKTLIYVGMSVNIYNRLGQHSIAGKVFDEFKYVEIDINQCIEVEHNLIELIKPKLNKTNRLYNNQTRIKLDIIKKNSEGNIYKCSYCGKEYISKFPKLYHNNACKQKAYRDRRDGYIFPIAIQDSRDTIYLD